MTAEAAAADIDNSIERKRMRVSLKNSIIEGKGNDIYEPNCGTDAKPFHVICAHSLIERGMAAPRSLKVASSCS